MTDQPNAHSVEVAWQIATHLHGLGHQCAFGGSIALAFWGEPRGTIDLDLTLFLSPEQLASCLWLLQHVGCEIELSDAAASLQEYGFCRVRFAGRGVNVFLPTTAFHETARQRRRRVLLAGQPVMIWDAETLCVFKMMFLRRKDLADVEQVLRVQGPDLDRAWVELRLAEIFGPGDPRLSEWRQLCAEVSN